MTPGVRESGWRAAAAAGLLVLAGALLGVAVDRTWIRPPAGTASPGLSVEGMARSLDLDPDTRRRVASLVDSMDAAILRAARSSPDSLRMRAREARQRIEAVLPPDRVPEFRRWMREHHRSMMRQMHGEVGRPGHGPRHRPGMGPRRDDRRGDHRGRPDGASRRDPPGGGPAADGAGPRR